MIFQPQEVLKIIEEDDYQLVNTPHEKVLPGDVAVYFAEDDIEHSGIVVASPATDFDVPTILSKWGSAHEAVHKVWDCPYDAKGVKYYRICT